MKFSLSTFSVLATTASQLALAAPLGSFSTAQDLAPRAAASGSSSKRGVLYLNSATTSAFSDPPFVWSYNYGSAPNGAHTGEFVPMLHGAVDADWTANVAAAHASGSKHLLAFNEPDQPVSAGGTAMSPAQAASLYKSTMNPYAGKFKLGAPAVSAGGIAWLQQFAQACAGECHVDFIPLHFYADASQSAAIQATSLSGFMTTTIPEVRGYFGGAKLPIWVTEFSVLPNTGAIDTALASAYMAAVLPALDSNPDIARYSYFTADQLVSGTQLNTAGAAYAA